MAADDHMFDAQHVDRVLQDRQAVEVGMDDDVGDIAVYEQLARPEADDLVRGDAAVRTADPQVPWRLLLGQRLEEGGIAGGDGACPRTVVIEQLPKGGHVRQPIGNAVDPGGGAGARRSRT
jgi:hypothetical protein